LKTVKEGSFWEHLEEFRRRLFLVLGTVAAAIIAAFVFSRWMMETVISRSPMPLQTLAPAEAFSAHLNLSLAAGILAASPVIFYQFWRFVSPGLYRDERRKAIRATAVCLLLFAAGAAFAWFLMLDPAIEVFRSFETGSIHGSWSLSNFVSFLGRFVLIFGIAFQLPVMVLLLVGMGFVTPEWLSKYRRHVIIALLITAAILTPPDPLTQVMLTLPLYVLFELSLIAAKIGGRKRK
jgi:sec-independent protein translocase protein TatC